uniref:Ig-like domain-containing protein n=1 Tax=Globodera pallida TaxID=36090 RepID=A0A183BPL7_GLOPA
MSLALRPALRGLVPGLWECCLFWVLSVCNGNGSVLPVICPTRLETRTKEFSVCASHWELKTQGRNESEGLLAELMCDLVHPGVRAQHSPVPIACDGAETEQETLVEVRSDSDVQIDRLTWECVTTHLPNQLALKMDGAGAGHLYSAVIGLYATAVDSLAMTCRRVVVVALKALGVGPAGASTSADLGGSSKYSSTQGEGPVPIACEWGGDRAYALTNPKDGELFLSRMKPEETLVEVRSDSDVQIDRLTWECVTTHLPNQLALKMDGAGAGHLYSAVIGLYATAVDSLAMTCRRVVVVALKALGVGPAGASTSADLGGSSKYSSQGNDGSQELFRAVTQMNSQTSGQPGCCVKQAAFARGCVPSPCGVVRGLVVRAACGALQLRVCSSGYALRLALNDQFRTGTNSGNPTV